MQTMGNGKPADAVRSAVAALNDGDIDGYLQYFDPFCLPAAAVGALQGAVAERGELGLDAAEPRGVRRGVGVEQILDMVAAIAKIPGDAGYREPIIRAALDAIRPAKDG